MTDYEIKQETAPKQAKPPQFLALLHVLLLPFLVVGWGEKKRGTNKAHYPCLIHWQK